MSEQDIRAYYSGEKQVAWDSVKAAYTRKITGRSIGESGGPFDFVADAAPFPGPPIEGPFTSTPKNPNRSYKAHATAFIKLREIFEDEWASVSRETF